MEDIAVRIPEPDHFHLAPAPIPAFRFAVNDDIADPEAGWATRNPDQAMLFLFVSPRDGAMVDELMAL